MDSTVATGAAAMMAIKVLIDHNVQEQNIVLLTMLCAPQGLIFPLIEGLHAVSFAFPKVKIITAMVDPGLDEKLQITPGFGNLANRYFGTEEIKK